MALVSSVLVNGDRACFETSASLQDELANIPAWPNDISTALGLTNKEIEKCLNTLEDTVAEHPLMLIDCSNYSLIKNLLGCFSHLTTSAKLKLIGVLVSGFNKAIRKASNYDRDQFRDIFCAFIVLLSAAIPMAEKAMPLKKSVVAKDDFDWSHLRDSLLEAIKSFIAIEHIDQLVCSEATRNILFSSLTKFLCTFLESPEIIKHHQSKQLVLECICSALGKHNGAMNVKTAIIQNLTYHEHLSETMAELVSAIIAKYPSLQLPSDILQSIGEHNFSPNENVKVFGIFISRLAQLSPREILRDITLIIGLLDSELHSMRLSMIEMLGHLMLYLRDGAEARENSQTQLVSFFELLEERFRDVNSFVRAKALAVLGELVKANVIPSARRIPLLELVASRVMDKSSNVRRKAIQLLGEFIRAHPFCIEGGELSIKHFTDRLQEVNKVLENIQASNENDEPLSEDQTTQVSTLMLQKRYYSDAVKFVNAIEQVIPKMCQLLSSSTKLEVFDVMDFFVEAYAYKIEGAKIGVRKMMHLIWEKDLYEAEGGAKKSIRDHLLESYRKIHIDVDERLDGRDRVIAIAQNLLLMIGMSNRAELASLEMIMMAMLAKRWISNGVIETLYCVLGSKSIMLPGLQSNALVLISMLAKESPEIVLPNIDLIVKQGLLSNKNDPLMAEYAFATLENVFTNRLDLDNPIFNALFESFNFCIHSGWLQVVTKMTQAIYRICAQPSMLLGKLIKKEASELFCDSNINTWKLTRLIHLVGNVAICESAHLDAIEAHYKNCNTESTQSKAINEYQQISGTMDDELAMMIGYSRENEMLFGKKSLLAPFANLVSTICSQNDKYPDSLLQIVSSLALAKFMNVSSIYCQENLPLLLTILEQSTDAIVRANLVLALGDLIQSHGRLVDQNVDLLFKRLQDKDALVQRQALLVLTHLSLTGLVKVKGRLGDIAKCLVHADSSAADLAKLFFQELSSKDPLAIYNHIPDVVSTLLEDELAESSFQAIMKIVFGYVKKEKQMEGLVEKLIQRFRVTTCAKSWRNISYCLQLIPYSNEKTFCKLVDGLPVYKDKMALDHEVYRNIADILLKAKKNFGNNTPELKSLIDDFESKLISITKDADHQERTVATDALSTELTRLSIDASLPSKKEKSTRQRRKKDPFAVSDDDCKSSLVYRAKKEVEAEKDSEDETSVLADNRKAKLTATKPKLRIMQSSDDDDSALLSGPEA